MKQTFNQYWRLMRFPQPIGIYLLWFPTAWALWLAYQLKPPITWVLLFLAGTIIMRAAGCVMNDIADRNFDKHVERTKHRPLTSGEVTLHEAIILLAVLLFMALIIALQLPIRAMYAVIPALLLTIIYPFCKRFFHAPQAVLGLAFSMSIPMVYLTANHPFDTHFYLLMIINTLWIIAYDSIYAMADKKDDVHIGIHSTALLFKDYDYIIVSLLQWLVHALWLLMPLSNMGLIFWALAALNLISQQILIRSREPALCIRAFKQNAVYGLLMWISIGI